MFVENTLFILGAGASIPYGFPSGDEFVGKIIDNIRRDSVFYPSAVSDIRDNSFTPQRWNIDSYQEILDSNDFQNKLQKIREAIKKEKFGEIIKKERLNITANLSDGQQITSSYNVLFDNKLILIKLNSLQSLSQLADALEEFHPVSIDAFLRDHPEHENAGRIMIIYTLLKYHKSDKFRKDAKNDNWYRYFLNDLMSGCTCSGDILKNTCNVLTFNYDVSLAYYLKNRLSKTSYFSEHHADFIKTFNIDHIYGSICDPHEVNDFFDIKYSIKPDNYEEREVESTLNFHNFLYGFYNGKRIKLIGERQGDEKIYSLIKEANKIIVIGFSFDSDNVHLLFNRKYNDLLNNKFKKLYYLDYEGSMNGLHNDFSRLCKEFGDDQRLEIIRSVQSGKSPICNAYNYDFKSRL